MDWQQAVARRLIADAACAAIAGDRWDWYAREQTSVVPGGVLELVSDDRPQHLKGFYGRRGSRVQVNCLAHDRPTAFALREAAISALVVAGTFDGVGFSRGMIENVTADAETTDGSHVIRARFDVLLWHD